MYEAYFSFRSAVSAQTAAMILSQYGIHAKVSRLPQSMSSMGCGYAVKIPSVDLSVAEKILAKEGIIYERAYSKYGEIGWT